MGTKRRAVVEVDKEQLDAIEVLIDRGRYGTLSDFVREAIEEKLDRLRGGWLAQDVERYCGADGADDEDDDLVAAQAFDDEPPRRGSGGRPPKG